VQTKQHVQRCIELIF